MLTTLRTWNGKRRGCLRKRCSVISVCRVQCRIKLWNVGRKHPLHFNSRVTSRTSWKINAILTNTKVNLLKLANIHGYKSAVYCFDAHCMLNDGCYWNQTLLSHPISLIVTYSSHEKHNHYSNGDCLFKGISKLSYITGPFLPVGIFFQFMKL